MSISKSALPVNYFKRGDLAVTVNSRAPLLNDGHIVRIVAVLGPIPERNIQFGYGIERIDGQPFVFVLDTKLNIPVPGGTRTVAHHWQLRPLVDSNSAKAGQVTGGELLDSDIAFLQLLAE